MKKLIKSIVYRLQIILLVSCYWLLKPFIKKNSGTSWVVGVSEIGQTIHYLPELIKPAVSVCLNHNFSYDSKYDYSISKKIKQPRLHLIARLVYGPLLLAYLLNKHSHFLYIWCEGFLINREFEFKFIKKLNKKLVCSFVGSDIRSPKLMLEYAEEHNLDTFIDYFGNANPFFISNDYEQQKKEIARLADTYADLVFSLENDQASYLQSKQHFFPYYFADNKFHQTNKFNDLEKIKIVHAPSNPFVKGTPLVRAAIKKLQEEGYKFEYVELQKMHNSVVLGHLKTAHIVLNQFHGFMPGLFGIEGMANNCAVLMSANPDIEKGLPANSKEAWVVTGYWQVYDHLKMLLDNPQLIKQYADNGYQLVKDNYTFAKAEETINNILKENNII